MENAFGHRSLAATSALTEEVAAVRGDSNQKERVLIKDASMLKHDCQACKQCQPGIVSNVKQACETD